MKTQVHFFVCWAGALLPWFVNFDTWSWEMPNETKFFLAIVISFLTALFVHSMTTDHEDEGSK